MSIKPFYCWIAILCAAISGCKKSYQGNGEEFTDPHITNAEQFFTDSMFSQRLGSEGGGNIRLTTKRQLLWDRAFVVNGSNGAVVVCPVKYDKDLFVRTGFGGANLFSLNDINRMVFFRDSLNVYHGESVTLFPDLDYVQGDGTEFSGMLFMEDWKGNALGRYQLMSSGQVLTYKGGTQANDVNSYSLKQADAAREVDVIISTCSQISGYNYSADGGDTYEWSEPESCTSEYFPDPVLGGSMVGGTRPGNLVQSRLAAMTFTVSSGKQPIKDISTYFGCFAISSGPGVSYSVEICVDQPDPGTRQPWGWSNSGVGASILGDNPVNVGHSFLVLTENNNGSIVTRNIGFYPTTYVAPMPTSAATTQGMLNDDETHGYDISLTINDVSSTQFQGILNYLSLGNNQGFSYDLNTQNCSSFALNALAAGSIVVPTTKGVWPYGSGDDPGDLGEDIRGMSLGSNETRNTTSSPHPNTGNCQY